MKNKIFLIDNDTVVNNYNESLIINKLGSDTNIKKIADPFEAVDYFQQEKSVQNQDTTIHLFLDVNFPKTCCFEFMESLENLGLDDHYDFRVYLLTTNNSTIVHEKKHVFPIVKNYIRKPLTKEKLDKLNVGVTK
jgi:two-component SAPR family response regulator